MAIARVSPYLMFNGTAAQAIELYERALGAKTENLMRYGDGPVRAAPEHAGRVMHAALRIGSGLVMLSDAQPDDPTALEGNAHVYLELDDLDELARAFEALAPGGRVTMPLQDTFWGSRFGMLTDTHGVRWMLECPLQKKNA
jgi:PhnB protein